MLNANVKLDPVSVAEKIIKNTGHEMHNAVLYGVNEDGSYLELDRAPDIYDLLGREYLITMGLIRPQDAVEDVVYVMDFWKRYELAWHRNDGHLTNSDFGHRAHVFVADGVIQKAAVLVGVGGQADQRPQHGIHRLLLQLASRAGPGRHVSSRRSA